MNGKVAKDLRKFATNSDGTLDERTYNIYKKVWKKMDAPMRKGFREFLKAQATHEE